MWARVGLGICIVANAAAQWGGYHTRLRDAEIHTKATAEEQRGWDFSLPLQSSFPSKIGRVF